MHCGYNKSKKDEMELQPRNPWPDNQKIIHVSKKLSQLKVLQQVMGFNFYLKKRPDIHLFSTNRETFYSSPLICNILKKNNRQQMINGDYILESEITDDNRNCIIHDRNK